MVKVIKINKIRTIWSTLIPTTGMKHQSRSLESSVTPTTELLKHLRRTDFPSWPALTTELNLMESNPAKIAILNPKRATRAQDPTKQPNQKKESTYNLTFLNQLTLTLTAKRRLATSEDLNMEKKTRMITPIFLKYNLRPTQIRIRTPTIFTIIPMYSLPLKESTCQEKRSLRKTQCDPRHRTASGKE